jgi:predicted metal-dependent peptidase
MGHETAGLVAHLNPAFFAALAAQEQVALLKHEVMRVALEHAFRRGTRDLLRWNIACDCVINLMIEEEGGSTTLPKPSRTIRRWTRRRR